MEMLRCGVNQRVMSIEWYKDKESTLLVVATLVATVTFAAGFTLPGGYQSEGMPTFVRQKKFEEFLWWDTMAMVFSTVAVIVLVWVQFVRHLLPTFLLLHFAQILNILGLECMLVAFISGLHCTLVDNQNLSKNISRVGYTSYFILLAIIVQYLSPIMYIFPGYIYIRSWVHQLADELFGSSCEHDDRAMMARKYKRFLEKGKKLFGKFRSSFKESANDDEDSQKHNRKKAKAKDKIQCFTCGGIGHISTVCPNNATKAKAMRDNRDNDSSSDSDSDTSDCGDIPTHRAFMVHNTAECESSDSDSNDGDSTNIAKC